MNKMNLKTETVRVLSSEDLSTIVGGRKHHNPIKNPHETSSAPVYKPRC